MILLDLSQVMISSIIEQAGTHADNLDINLVRHMILNNIRSLKVNFSKEYGELVIACDDKNYWRKGVFPNYKANRKTDREKSTIDWNVLFDALNLIKQEIKEYFPYRVIQVKGAEADDVIATLVFEFGEVLNTDNKILILSGDKDFIQLQTYGNVKQYDPVRKKDISSDNPIHYREHLVLTGDRGDGIPNVLSPDNCLVEGIRQKPLRETKINEILSSEVGNLPQDIQRNWQRNRMLIDLTMIPSDIKNQILSEYHAQANKNKSKLFNYFIDHKMKVLIEAIGDF
jgi:hypothetical protein